MLADPEMKELAAAELESLRHHLPELEFSVAPGAAAEG